VPADPKSNEDLFALSERLKAPMVHALCGTEHVEWENPYDVGIVGLIGFSSEYCVPLDCDVLLMLGTESRRVDIGEIIVEGRS
jgi:pyruvate dehydrogenase (quinone)